MNQVIYIRGQLKYIGYDFHINLPSRISFQQFEVVKDIVNQIKLFENDFRVRIEYFDADSILEEARKKVSGSYLFEDDEKIVGVPIDENIIIHSIIKDISLDSCKNSSDVIYAVKKLLEYYQDGFFKDKVLMICPSIEKIEKIFRKIRIIQLFEEQKFDVDDVSFENILDILEKYYKLNKELLSADLDVAGLEKSGRIFNSYDLMHEKKSSNFLFDYYISEANYYIRLSKHYREDYKILESNYQKAFNSGDEEETIITRDLMEMSYNYDKSYVVDRINGLKNEILISELMPEQKKKLVLLIDGELGNLEKWQCIYLPSKKLKSM